MCSSLHAQESVPTSYADADRAGERGYTLEQLLDSARQNNIVLRNARHNVDAARLQRKEAFTKYFPNVSATGLWFNANKGMIEKSVNPSQIIPAEMTGVLSQMLPASVLSGLADPIGISMMKHGTVAGVTAVQPVFAGGQIVNGNRLARVGEDVSRLQMQLSENEVEKTVEQYFWQIVTLQEKKKTVEAVEAMLADIHKDVETAVKAGVALRNDLLQVQLKQNEVESQKLKLDNALFIVRQLLGQYAGLTPSPFNSLSTPLAYRGVETQGVGSIYQFEVVAPDMQQDRPLPSLVGENRGMRHTPEYQLLTKQVEAAELQRRMEVGKNLPTVAVGAGYNYHNLLQDDHAFAMLFATVSVPISDWWGGSHAVKRKKIALQQAKEQLDDNAELLTIRLQKAYNDVAEAQQQLSIAAKSIEQAEENLRLHRDFYRAGTATMSDLLEAQTLYQQAMDKHADAHADYRIRLLEYKQAGGGR